VAPFRDMPMQSLEAVLEGARMGRGLMPPDAALGGLPESRLSEDQCRVLRHGQAVRSAVTPPVEPGRRVRLYGPAGEFLGLAEARPEGWLQPRRLLLPDAT
jgi:tRNA pseudouridine55 synthase